MALFLTTGLPSSSVSVVQSDIVSDFIDTSTEVLEHENFLRLLQNAISLETQILPLTWDPALEKLGADGATGSVNQSLLNSQVTFAYKRFRVETSSPHLSEPQFRKQQYDAMINELTILSVSALREHPNIVAFFGLCFELSPSLNAIWPVLVFSRSVHGDLATFMANSQRFDPEFIFSVCKEVSKGIDILHRCGIVHGDLKPGNILVSQDSEQDAISIRLADFGYSRHATTDDHLVRLTRSEPWEAPEWRAHQYFSLGDAKRQDIYSFGLICMWLLFGYETMDSWDFPTATVHTMFTDPKSPVFDEFQYRKHSPDDLILKIANKLLIKNDAVADEGRARLNKVFGLTLTTRRESRSPSMEEIVEFLSGEDDSIAPEKSQDLARAISPQWHGSLQIEKLFFHLESCDFRLHKFLVDCLVKMANTESCDICSRNAAFQLALCHIIGFGTIEDRALAKTWVSKGGRTLADALATAQRSYDSKKGADVLAILAKQGYRHNYSSTYRRDGILPEAINYYRHMTRTHQELFGPASSSVLRLQGILVDLLREDEKSSEALDCCLEMFSYVDSLPLSDQTEIKTKLLRIYQDLGRYDEVENLTNELLENYTTGPEKDHSERLEIQQEYIEVMMHQRNFTDAVSLAEDNVRNCTEELTRSHTTTRRALRILVAASYANGQIDRAIEVEEELVGIQEHVVLEQEVNPKLVEDLSRLGLRHYLQNDQNSALRCYEKVNGLIKRDQGVAKQAIIAVNNFAAELIRQGRLDTASRILEALRTESEKHIERQPQEAALVMGNLAYVYSQQGYWEAAEPLEQEVLAVRKRVLGPCHHDTVTAMGQLRSTLLVRGRFEEAAKIGQEEYAAIENRAAVSVSEKFVAVQHIARAFESAGAYKEAIPFLHLGIMLMNENASEELAGAFSVMALMAVCCLQAQEVEEARAITVDLLILIQEAKGARVDVEDFFDQLLVLGQIFLSLQFGLECEQILALVSLILQQSDQIAPSLKLRINALISLYREKTGNQNEKLIFNPSLLLNEGGRSR